MFQRLTIDSQIMLDRLDAQHNNLNAHISAYNTKAVVFFDHLGPLRTKFFYFRFSEKALKGADSCQTPKWSIF
jgi:hypothetical protein